MKHIPNFFCIGAQKAGTTLVRNILIRHKDIYLPHDKEAHFFHVNERFQRGYDWYWNKFFADYSGQRIVGSVTPEYLFFPEVPERIRSVCGPDVKLVVILRDPAERAFSQYQMTKLRGLEKLSFLDAIEIEQDRIRRGRIEQNHFSYISRGMYARQLLRYIDIFPFEDFVFVRFKDLITYTLITINSICVALGLYGFSELPLHIDRHRASKPIIPVVHRQIWNPESQLRRWAKQLPVLRSPLRIAAEKLDKLNRRMSDIRLSNELRLMINRKYFYEDIERTQQLTGLNLRHWLC